MTSDNNDYPAPLVQPEMASFAWLSDRGDVRTRIGRGAVVLAALAHVALLLWLLLNFNDLFAPPKVDAPVPVHIVFAPPPAPPPPPASPPKPKPQPQPKQELTPRQSGADDKTTKAPAAETPGPAAAPPKSEVADKAPETAAPAAQPAEPVTPQTAVDAPPLPAEKPKPREEAARRSPRLLQEAQIPRAPHPAAHDLADRALGDRDETGDPYLNRLWALINRNRPATTPIGSAGLHLEGISVFQVLIDHSGQLLGLRLVQSSGAPQLDEVAQKMIEAAGPFPAFPANYPDRIALTASIHLFP